MRSNEKAALGIGIIAFILFVTSCNMLVSQVNDAGGLRVIVIEGGKEVKKIYKEINEETKNE